jgi:hypothetical protein
MCRFHLSRPQETFVCRSKHPESKIAAKLGQILAILIEIA